MAKQPPTMTKLKDSVLRTPRGTARYCYVNKPDDSTYGKDRFRVTVVFDKNDPEFKQFVLKLKALASQHCDEIGKPVKSTKIPLKLVDEKMSKGKDGKGGTGDPIGAPCMEFEANSVINNEPVKIRTFDAKGQEDALQVYSGDIVRVEARFTGWMLKGDHGLKGYLNAVQQLQSNWEGRSAGSMFEAEEEYITDDDDSPADELPESEGSTFTEDEESGTNEESGTDDGSEDTDDLLDGLV